MAAKDERASAHALVEDLLGPSDARADRSIEVLHAHAAALAWVREAVGSYPTPAAIAVELEQVAEELRRAEDEREPVLVLRQAALRALTAYRTASGQ
ncbi:hypothetical protein I6A60_09455 [Frankia sp. AgB1.9]|uniref:hypothetical protein n=1 Tax=unclassified Frankia TaxID=2632575 RepID=UPI001932D863|nr:MULTISPECIES: hypothetical protein [unclassified Frankia]MBL7488258.1 hypothetical protein [Frankia sp. AgW1.1]MBL7548099.1 hypothetical protein [Frankia sp. AgB1.9]MBL7620325.1 hypothetical protein [Frankia sp. AgB1.8]